MRLQDKIANAERLAELNRADAARYAEQGATGLAWAHSRKAEQWAATAADLRGAFGKAA